MDVIQIINERYDELSKTQQRISNYIMENPEKACFQSLKDFSEAANASPVSVLRFVEKIGLDSYIELKKELQLFIRMRVSPGQKLVTALDDPHSDDENMLEQIVRADLQNISTTFEALDRAELYHAVDILKNSKRVYLAAQGVSKSLLPFLHNRLSVLAIETVVFDIDSRIFITKMLSAIKPTDTFIIVSFPRRKNNRIPFLAEQLSKHGNPIICITDSIVSDVANYATVSLACATETPIHYNSYSAAMVMANALVSLLAVQLKDEVRDFQQQVNELLDEYSSFSAARDAKKEE